MLERETYALTQSFSHASYGISHAAPSSITHYMLVTTVVVLQPTSSYYQLTNTTTQEWHVSNKKQWKEYNYSRCTIAKQPYSLHEATVAQWRQATDHVSHWLSVSTGSPSQYVTLLILHSAADVNMKKLNDLKLFAKLIKYDNYYTNVCINYNNIILHSTMGIMVGWESKQWLQSKCNGMAVDHLQDSVSTYSNTYIRNYSLALSHLVHRRDSTHRERSSTHSLHIRAWHSLLPINIQIKYVCMYIGKVGRHQACMYARCLHTFLIIMLLHFQLTAHKTRPGGLQVLYRLNGGWDVLPRNNM